MNTQVVGDHSVEAQLDRELSLIRDAIALVDGGASPRVVLAGLQFGDRLIEQARRMAAASGVSVVPLWTTDERGADIAIERPAGA
jgi:hypothetical protein